ncbi:TRAP transporter small permease [Aromatoleum buckelii]|uniref:TRAP transporter small permease protein n=1 Tax=Aromatoleum buckelii TaxID=200254 RepID=A0ABX1N607_9RHOO|nr:TRAP transporter small permease [Aromatoleum buckelii]MCK0509670.1 TRAP transporter small permease [Aromatoleum buckelii]
MSRVHSLARSLVSALAALGVAAYGGAALVTVADVIGRTVDMPVQGVVDLVQLFVVTGAWLVMPYAFMTGAHVGVDFVINSLPKALRVPLQLFAAAVALVLVGLMLWYGFETFEVRSMFGDRSQQLGIPVAWYWYPLLIGLTVSLLGVVLETAATWQRVSRHE